MNDGYGPRKAQLMIGAHLHNNTQLLFLYSHNIDKTHIQHKNTKDAR